MPNCNILAPDNTPPATPAVKPKAKLSFKREARQTGLRAVGAGSPDTQIKLNGRMVGRISGGAKYTSRTTDWVVRVCRPRTPTPESPSPFDWAQFKVRHANEQAARTWVTSHWAEIVAKGLYQHID